MILIMKKNKCKEIKILIEMKTDQHSYLFDTKPEQFRER